MAEFQSIEKSARSAFKKKLAKLVSGAEKPTPKNALYGFPKGFYKIKLRKAGLRLVYKYDGENLTVLVISVGRRQRNLVYEVAKARLEGML